MTHTHEHTLPSANGKEIVIPALLAALSVAAISLPIVTMKTIGFSGSIAPPSPHLLGGTAYFLPLAFLLSISSRFAPQARPYRRMIEIGALAVAAGVALYVVVTLLNGLSKMNAANRQMSHMLGSAATRQFSLSSAVSLRTRQNVARVVITVTTGPGFLINWDLQKSTEWNESVDR